MSLATFKQEAEESSMVPTSLSAPKPLKPPTIGIRMSPANEPGMTSSGALPASPMAPWLFALRIRVPQGLPVTSEAHPKLQGSIFLKGFDGRLFYFCCVLNNYKHRGLNSISCWSMTQRDNSCLTCVRPQVASPVPPQTNKQTDSAPDLLSPDCLWRVPVTFPG